MGKIYVNKTETFRTDSYPTYFKNRKLMGDHLQEVLSEQKLPLLVNQHEDGSYYLCGMEKVEEPEKVAYVYPNTELRNLGMYMAALWEDGRPVKKEDFHESTLYKDLKWLEHTGYRLKFSEPPKVKPEK